MTKIDRYLAEAKKNHRKHFSLLKNIKKNLPKLEELLKLVNDDFGYEDLMYRYYHGSFKVYYMQDYTEKICVLLKKISPHKNKVLPWDNKRNFNDYFERIVKQGTGISFNIKHNNDWAKVTDPIVMAFLHSKYFLEMAIKYGNWLEQAPEMLPSGWASLLHLYEIR